MAGAAALVGASMLPQAVLAQSGLVQGGLAPAVDLLAAVRRFLATLDDGGRAAASFPWNGRAWRLWSYFATADNIKPGLRLEQMSETQATAAWAVLAAVLSDAGLAKARNVMRLGDVLAADFGERYSSQRFSFAVFGTPSEIGSWGFRLEGHHLTLSVSVREGAIVSVTPSSFSANPNHVTSGQHAGLIALREEEFLARTLFGALDPKRQGRARLTAKPLTNILSTAGRERAHAQALGIAAAELGAAPRDILWRLIDTYTADHLAPVLAAAQRSRVRSGDRDAVHFAWYGPNAAEHAFGYRLAGPHFVIEFASVDPAAQHLHTIYHDLDTVLGRTA
ncbi:MAG: DUF3500 domain-containing protein [Hyphomicrobiales bacterium]|nr:DUF3500 domain-containing protein [Hyphomicrobiales bacterium]